MTVKTKNHTKLRPIAMAIAAALPLLALAAPAKALTLYTDRAAFNTALSNAGFTPDIDDGTSGNFGAAPATGGTSGVTRTALAPAIFEYSIRDANIRNNNNLNGTLSGDVRSISNIFVEDPAIQAGATQGTWGVDSRGGNNNTRNAALFEFSRSISFFGVDLLDFEASADVPGLLRSYDANGDLIESISFSFLGPDFGDGQVNFLGIGPSMADDAFSALAFVLGDDDPNGSGNAERFAATRFTFATEEVPTPALLPGLIGMGVAALRKRKQTQEV